MCYPLLGLSSTAPNVCVTYYVRHRSLSREIDSESKYSYVKNQELAIRGPRAPGETAAAGRGFGRDQPGNRLETSGNRLGISSAGDYRETSEGPWLRHPIGDSSIL